MLPYFESILSVPSAYFPSHWFLIYSNSFLPSSSLSPICVCVCVCVSFRCHAQWRLLEWRLAQEDQKRQSFMFQENGKGEISRPVLREPKSGLNLTRTNPLVAVAREKSLLFTICLEMASLSNLISWTFLSLLRKVSISEVTNYLLLLFHFFLLLVFVFLFGC